MASADFDPERLLSTLSEAEVRYILIGGMAAVLHGDVGVTVDVDVVPERTAENREPYRDPRNRQQLVTAFRVRSFRCLAGRRCS